MDFKEVFSAHLNSFSTYPYLFIGSGFSRRYIGSESWSGLLEHMCNSLVFNRPYKYYESNNNGNLIKMASVLANEFNDKWWSSKDFEESRGVFTNPTTSSSPFKYEICKHLKSKNVVQGFESEIEILKEIKIEGIITTNYDTFLETIFTDYKAYIGQDNLLFKEALGIGEIYKIHGCVSDPNTLVLTEEDYKAFSERNIYLAAKLLTIFVEHPIIFMGYSLTDTNIVEIINNIVKCLDSKNISKLTDRLIFVQWESNASGVTFSDGVMTLNNSIPIQIKQIKTNSFEPVFEVLSNLNARMPVKILRKLNDLICDYVKTNKPTKVKLIGPQENIEKEDIEFVYGVGLIDKLGDKGYESIEIKDIYEDIVFDKANYDPSKIIQSVFPRLLKGKTFVPIFKYLSKYSGTIDYPKLEEIKDSIIINDYYPAPSYTKKNINKLASLEELLKKYDPIHCFYYIPLLNKNKINLDMLRNFLEVQWPNIDFGKDTFKKKVVCFYDYLKYKK